MTLPGLLFSGRKATFVAVVVLSVLSALLSVAVLAFISQRLLAGGAELGMVLMQFALLLLALLATATGAQVTLHRLGHRMVYGLRRDLVRRVLATDIEQLEKVGGPPLLAALSTDTRNLTIAFVHLPELVYGAALSVAALSWLAWLSPALFAVTVVWLVATAGMGIWLVGRINFHVGKVREGDDHLYQDYQAMIDGRKELALNRARAARFYQEEFDDHARAYRDHVTRADIFNGVAGNMANVLMLALIGVLFYLASGLGWASANTASVFALTILLLRTPLIGAVAALPTLLAARVSLKKLAGLQLAEGNTDFAPKGESLAGFKQLSLKGACYRYPDQDGVAGFEVGPLDLTVKRGELIFVQGGNGSGKSTFARLLTGLYRPLQGTCGYPRIPPVFAGKMGDNMVHSSRYKHEYERFARHEAPRIAVIGAGQSAAEIYLDLMNQYPHGNMDLISRSRALHPSDDSAFVNEIFDPAFTDTIYGRPEAERRDFLQRFSQTNYAVVDMAEIEQIYERLYLQKITGKVQHRYLSNRDIVAVVNDGKTVQMTLRDKDTGVEQVEEYDGVVLATGYNRDGHERLLAPMADWLSPQGIERCYRLPMAEGCHANVFLQGCCEETPWAQRYPVVGAGGTFPGSGGCPAAT